MPAGPYHGMDDSEPISFDRRTRGLHDLTDLNGDESAASILQSVKEQERQFEQLTRELEVERKSVANQLEKCKLGSETASMSSISSTDESFHWRPPPHDQRFDEESETDSKMSGSHLVDSCLRVLQDRGLMSTDNYQDYMPEEVYKGNQTGTQQVTNSQELHHQHNQSGTPNTSQSYINYTYQAGDINARQPSPRSPVGSSRDAPTPTQQPPQNHQGYYSEGFDRQQSYREEFDDFEARPSLPSDNPPVQNGPYGSYNNISPGGQSPRQPDDSFHGSQTGYNNQYTDTTTTTTTVKQTQQQYGGYRPDDSYTPSDQGPPRDQYGSEINRFEERQYSSTRVDEMNYQRAPSDRPMDSPRGPPFRPGFEENRSLRSQSPAGSMDRGPGPYGSQSRIDAPPMLGAPPGDQDMNRRSPSINSANRAFDIRYRNPDLPEVIEYLSHHNDMVKANAAAYLQHLTYMDNDVKSKTRGLGGIPVLVELVNNDIPEVHRAACGALKNLSYGRANEENKKAIKNAGGIPALIRLLRKTTDNDVRELVTGILWNLSSLKDLKRPIIDDGLSVLVGSVIVPHSGWDPNQPPSERKPMRDIYWSTVFRNASGVLRNVSSDGQYARTKLRECDGLVDAIVFIVQAAIGKSDIDNKSVENCVCVLRNLSFACQEVQDKNYLSKRSQLKLDKSKGESTGCFGGSKKKKEAKDQKNKQGMTNPNYANTAELPRGMALLWHSTIVPVYLPLLYDCTNPETLEAAAGAIQNLAACEWQPSQDVRETVRKQKGLPVLVELLHLEADKVVCAAATALRNLSLDPQSKELIGKYAMRQLVQRLPEEGSSHHAPNSDETISALEALLYEVIKTNTEFATSLLSEGGVERLRYIVRNDKFEYKVRKYASSILTKMWDFKDLHPKYRERNWKDVDFLVKPIDPRKGSPSKSLPPSAENTLNRPRMDQSGPTLPGYNENTLPYVNRPPTNNVAVRERLNDTSFSRGYEMGPNDRFAEIPMTELGPQSYAAPPVRGPESPTMGGYYASVNHQDDSRRQEELRQIEELRRQEDLDRQSDQYPSSQPYNRQGDYDPNQSYDRPPQMDYNPRAQMDYDPRHEDSDRQSDRGPQGPVDYRGVDLEFSQQQDLGPPSGIPMNFRPEGDYTPQGSEYSRREDYPDQYPSDPTRREDYRPPGGVALFPNLRPAPPVDHQTPEPQQGFNQEPLYARVVKPGNRSDSGIMLDGGPPSGGGGPGGADSWV